MVGKFIIIFFAYYVKKAHGRFFAVRFFSEFIILFGIVAIVILFPA